MPGGDAIQAVLATDGGNVSAMDSAVYFIPSEKGSRPAGRRWQERRDGGSDAPHHRMDLATPKGYGRSGSAGVFDGFGRQARSRRRHAESSIECVVVSVSRSVGWRNGMGGRVRTGQTITAGADGLEPLRGAGIAGAIEQHPAFDRAGIIWHGTAVDGMPAIASQGCGFGDEAGDGAGDRVNRFAPRGGLA